ncbi:F-box domain containing protein [Tanacetum coccineum]
MERQVTRPGKKVTYEGVAFTVRSFIALQRLYMSSHTAIDMIWGMLLESVRSPVDAHPGVRLGLAADGFNPFGNLSQAYSMWPVIMTTYNLPPWLCMKESSFMLTLIPGPKSPGKDIDVYLRHLIEDLKDDMLKAQIKVVDILCKLELIYPPALFDIMVYLVIHLPIEALEDIARRFPTGWGRRSVQRHVDNDKNPEVSTTSELFALANGPSWTPVSVNSCVVDGILMMLKNLTVDDDGVEKVYSSEEEIDLELCQQMSAIVPRTGAVAWATVNRKPNLGGRGAGRLNTRDKTRNLSLKEIAVAKGPVPINFEQGDKQTLNPLGPHAAHWSNYIGEVVRSVPLYYPSWEKVPKERSADDHFQGLGSAAHGFLPLDRDQRRHQHALAKSLHTNKASFKAKHWKADPTTGSYDVEAIRRARPEEITAAEWDKYIKFWNDPKNLARAAQNRLNRQKSVASDTQEYPSLIDTFWRTHTIDGVFPKDEDRRIYEEMKRLEATGEYTEDEINALARGGKLRGHIPVFRSDSKYSDMFKEFESGGASRSGGCGDDEESGDDEDGDGDD